MNILRIIYDWPKPWAGLAPHPYEVTLAQLKKGYKIDLFCGKWPNSGVEKPKGVNVMPIIREPLPNTIFFTSSVILFFKYLKFRKTNQDDVIHSHGHFAIWIYLYRLILKKYFPWAKELKTPLVVHFHNTAQGRWQKFKDENKTIKPASQYIAWPLEVYSDKLAVQVAAACVFVSGETKKEAIEFYNAPEQKCFVVESGVNVDLFKQVSIEEKEKSRRDLDLDIYDKVILNHGMMNERKNIHVLIDALKFLPPHYKLILSGPGDSAYIQRLNEQINKAHLQDRIIRTGYVAYPECPIAYQVSDLFVLPSSWEGVPKVVMESLSCGVPCLVSGFKLSDEIQGLNYLEKIDSEFLAKRIYELTESVQRVDVDKVHTFYSWDSRISQIDKVYDYAIKNYI